MNISYFVLYHPVKYQQEKNDPSQLGKPALSVRLTKDYESLMKETLTLRIPRETWPILQLKFTSSDFKMQKHPSSDAGLIVEGVKVLQNLDDVTKACDLLL
ncbi:hypothetical protein QQF64_034357 [Cirrhinus molitorella]|uniref:Uncharacterized protein n=1 Tax=Cirrhinus molitorella TaxID=172907 RepID=A0ABR3L1B8_9TELE